MRSVSIVHPKPTGEALANANTEAMMTEPAWPNPESSKSPQAWPSPESAIRGVRGAVPRQQLRDALPEASPIGRDEIRERQKGFPEEPEIEYERSVIRIPFYLKGKVKGEEGREVDVLNFDAYMRLLREAPIRSGLGFRQFEFYIDAWELTNTYSKGLDSDITFTLSDTVQPKSLCVSLSREDDYPALIVYSAIYDVYLGSERVIENQPGVAFATPVWEVPPRNVTVAFEKPFESDLFAFSAGCCEGMRSIAREEFEEGVTEARRIRGQA